MFHVKQFDVVVIGGGHAGCEAASASARLGAKTALVTMNLHGVGAMSCNPAIGGLGKGHLVREIDAMGGVMGRAADYAGIQFRLLNRKKGPAVQGPRAQADRKRYRTFIQEEMQNHQNLDLIFGEVTDFLIRGETIYGVVLSDGTNILSKSVVLTTGTFLRGVIHIGDVSKPGGRMGDAPSVRLAERIDDLALPLGRLKTGTPPRLDGKTINWDVLERQLGDEDPVMFSFMSKAPTARQISCGITHTNEKTHEIIEENLTKSAMYGGHIDGIGPRYCPSIEDKIVRFKEKQSHQIFLEPEGLDDDTIYPNGISTSLPVDVQKSYVQSIVGLEHAEIVQPGYAIEYDYVDPRCLDQFLSVRSADGLYLAGQINGTTGYEEAAGQGLVAGLSAGLRSLGWEPYTFSRSTSYVGVMIDDLITRGVLEPYRMFTSRAEFRLSLRCDNADQRLTPDAIRLGLVDEDRKKSFRQKEEALDSARLLLTRDEFTPNQINAAGISVNQDGKKRTAMDILAFPKVGFDEIGALVPETSCLGNETKEQISREAMYHHYVLRQNKEAEALRRDEEIEIPSDFDYGLVNGLSSELTQKLTTAQPLNLSQATRIDGMTPAALTLILAQVKRLMRVKSA
jgi:tRNA uridine 5-carboxymethylaminomethyl modification enzyme